MIKESLSKYVYISIQKHLSTIPPLENYLLMAYILK